MKVSNTRLGFIGFGHMASVLFKAIDQAKLIPRSQILFTQRDPERSKKNEMKHGITATSLKNLVDTSDVLFLGVCPNQANVVLKELKKIGPNQNKMLITMIAGLKLNSYQAYWDAQLLRTMPNVASEVGEGMTTFTFQKGATSEFMGLARILFLSMGRVLTIPEELMDVATAIAGCGPAFVFRMINAFAKVGKKHGIDEKDALILASQTFLGAARMIAKGEHPETLVSQIAVPGSVTEAGIKKINALEIANKFEAVLETTMKRSIELSEEQF